MTQEEKRAMAQYATEKGAEMLLKRGLPLTDEHLAMMAGFVLGLLYAEATKQKG